jgi:hypothetical protein
MRSRLEATSLSQGMSTLRSSTSLTKRWLCSEVLRMVNARMKRLFTTLSQMYGPQSSMRKAVVHVPGLATLQLSKATSCTSLAERLAIL